MKGDLEIKLISNSKTAGQSPKRPRKWTSRYVILELGVITIYNRDHPYITSAYVWTFSDPPTYYVSINTVLNVAYMDLF